MNQEEEIQKLKIKVELLEIAIVAVTVPFIVYEPSRLKGYKDIVNSLPPEMRLEANRILDRIKQVAYNSAKDSMDKIYNI